MTRTTVTRPAEPAQLFADEQRCTWAALQTMVALVERAVDHDLIRETGLPQSYLHILCRLAEVGGEMRIGDLAVTNGLSGSRASHAVARLAEAGLVSRERLADDRRSVTVTLTEEGMGTLRSAEPTLASSLHQHLFGSLDAEQRGQLQRIAATVSAAMRRSAPDEAPPA
ncbi:MarR family transcriptional regulator [Pseudonocardia sp. NPDC049635]|uniref:MarR family winged helix-turn-helix transcriptional regulator n=1 Tax=Pseudonocardia sp. NPDC049635 TaxID=3155506 RepID=UPI0033E0A8AD